MIKITLDIEDIELDLTEEQARALYYKLNSLFGYKEPTPLPYPVPYYPYPSYPYVTWTDDKIGIGPEDYTPPTSGTFC